MDQSGGKDSAGALAAALAGALINSPHRRKGRMAGFVEAAIKANAERAGAGPGTSESGCC